MKKATLDSKGAHFPSISSLRLFLKAEERESVEKYALPNLLNPYNPNPNIEKRPRHRVRKERRKIASWKVTFLARGQFKHNKKSATLRPVCTALSEILIDLLQ